MRRWHSPREHALMLSRWKQEMRKHGYDWRCPPDPRCDRDACHCAAGIGSMRKRRPFDCGKTRCQTCHWGKWDKKARGAHRRAVVAEALDGDYPGAARRRTGHAARTLALAATASGRGSH